MPNIYNKKKRRRYIGTSDLSESCHICNVNFGWCKEKWWVNNRFL